MGTYAVDDLPIRSESLDFGLDTFALAGANAPTLNVGAYPLVDYQIDGVTANNNSKTSMIHRTLSAPPNMVTNSSIDTTVGESATADQATLKISARVNGSPAIGATIDASVAKSNKQGSVDTGVGTAGELVTTAAQSLTSSWVVYSFTVDLSGISPGDPLTIAIQCVNDDTGGSGGGDAEIGDVTITLNVRGE